jgi:integrase/recombinase XerD
MNIWPDMDMAAIDRYLQQLRPRSSETVTVYRCILLGFQRFVMKQQSDTALRQSTITAWLHERADQWQMHIVLHRARTVDRFLDFLVSAGSIPSNPFADLRIRCSQRTTAAIARALLADEPEDAIEALKPMPPFASFLGDFMRRHIDLMRAMGYRYNTQAGRFARFDRFLQGRQDLVDLPLEKLLQQWNAARPTLEQVWECAQVGRDLAKALRRLDPGIRLPPVDRQLCRQIKQQRRRPYIYTESELGQILNTARHFPSPCSALRPLSLYTMIVLGCCAGLRIGEIVRLDLDDVDMEAGQITVRETKFFKTRTLPLSQSVLVALAEYLEARRRAGASQVGTSGLFWHGQRAERYSYVATEKLLVRVLRRAGVKPEKGRAGPRIHDLRHGFVVNRMLQWYRAGINPQAHLPYLATYLGHKDINSTLIYLTITQELLQQAGERFRTFAMQHLHVVQGEKS